MAVAWTVVFFITECEFDNTDMEWASSIECRHVSSVPTLRSVQSCLNPPYDHSWHFVCTHLLVLQSHFIATRIWSIQIRKRIYCLKTDRGLIAVYNLFFHFQYAKFPGTSIVGWGLFWVNLLLYMSFYILMITSYVFWFGIRYYANSTRNRWNFSIISLEKFNFYLK
jgi:hypothetical protein